MHLIVLHALAFVVVTHQQFDHLRFGNPKVGERHFQRNNVPPLRYYLPNYSSSPWILFGPTRYEQHLPGLHHEVPAFPERENKFDPTSVSIKDAKLNLRPKEEIIGRTPSLSQTDYGDDVSHDLTAYDAESMQRLLFHMKERQQQVIIIPPSNYKTLFHKPSVGIVVTSTVTIASNVYCLPSDNFIAGSTLPCVISGRKREAGVGSFVADFEASGVQTIEITSAPEASPQQQAGEGVRHVEQPIIGSSIDDLGERRNEERHLFNKYYYNKQSYTTLTSYTFTTTTNTIKVCLFQNLPPNINKLQCIPCSYIVCPASFPSCN